MGCIRSRRNTNNMGNQMNLVGRTTLKDKKSLNLSSNKITSISQLYNKSINKNKGTNLSNSDSFLDMKYFGKQKKEKKTSTEAAKVSLEPVMNANYNLEEDKDPDAGFTCSGCNSEFRLSEIKKNLYVCPECGKHAKISAKRRVLSLADPGTFRRLNVEIPFKNPLNYPEYSEKQ